VGIGFLFAPVLHPAMRYAAGPRGQLGLRTIFNILGPLTNPAGARRQLLGAFSLEAAKLMAEALAALGAEHALVVHGLEGLDEISTCGPTRVLEVRDGGITEYTLTPGDFGMPVARLEDLAGGEPAEAAALFRRVLAGEPGPARDIVLVNAAAAVYVSGQAETLGEGLERGREALDSGKARGKLERLREVSVSVVSVSREGQ
jgi:anthranilate phosphoribosyltransferase